MIKSGTELLDLVYYDANGNPRFRRCCYTDSNGLNALAYPVHYCDGHTNRIYPNTDRTEWDVSTLQYKEDSPLCLGNKGTVMVFWPNGCGCFVSYNYGTSQFTDGANATVVDYYGTICLSLAKIADNSRYIYFVDNPYSRYRNGTVGYTDPSDYIRADDFVFYNRDFSLDTIVDELGNGQASGGSSHPYLSAELLLEIPTDFQGEVIADAPAHNQPTDNRPSLRFSDYINPYSQLDIHNRIRHDWTHNGRRFVLMDLLSKKNVVQPTVYTHLFTPYVFFMDQVRTGTRSYAIRDMLLNYRIIDSIRSGAT